MPEVVKQLGSGLSGYIGQRQTDYGQPIFHKAIDLLKKSWVLIKTTDSPGET
jgi:hypothetical protein